MGLVVMRDNSESKACMYVPVHVCVSLCGKSELCAHITERVLGVSWSFNGESQVGWRP